ncbi:restriction endonuclease subunit M/S [Seongchinamella unica]|uniref:site-specific DNA-methyltransferase (adenine-specific) n=1 Tax=Seongchinamella unica TaxID=2547392 RepID=A0A4R5LN65_9GAMM|nr:N-6 DNA methylase [Seongchinamella unica]TDG11651.1 restriction endonuclease subunit M/S [Seongchinamella unica]
MIEKDDKWFWNAVEVLREESLSQSEATRAIIELFHIGVMVPQGDLAAWLSTEEKSERVKYLRDRLEARGGERLNAVMVSELLERIPISMRRELVSSVLQADLPSLDVALQMLNLWYRATPGFFGIPFEMAKLSYQLAAKNGSADTRVLCRGVAAETMALAASLGAPTVYELGVQSGESFKRAVFDIAGTDVELRGKHDLGTAGLKESFSVGLIADSWGSRSTRPAMSKLESGAQFANVSTTVAEIMAAMKRVNGRIACVVPQSWLHKSFGDEAEFKRNLVASGRLDAVVQLPERTVVGMSAAPAIIIINTIDSFDAIQFIDARQMSRHSSRSSYRELVDVDAIVQLFDSDKESEQSKYVPVSEVLDNDVNLDIRRYIVDSDQERAQRLVDSFETTLRLGEVTEIIRCQAIRSATTSADIANSLFAQKFKEVSPAQVNEYGVIEATEGMREIMPLDKDLSRARRQVLQEGDVLFAIKGSLGKCALVAKEFEGCIGNQSFVILRTKNAEKMPPLVIHRYLISPLCKALISRWSTSGAVPMIKMQDLKKLPIPLMTADEINQVEQNDEELQRLLVQLDDIQSQLSSAMNELWSLD